MQCSRVEKRVASWVKAPPVIEDLAAAPILDHEEPGHGVGAALPMICC